MRRCLVVLALFCLNASGILLAQKGADPSQRYFRVIALVHLTGSGQSGDPIVPEYVVQGTAIAVAAQQATATVSAGNNAARPAEASSPPAQPVAPPVPMSSRPGYLAWSMQTSDNGKMAIIHIVASDHHAFDSILADTRPEIRVFEIGKDKPDVIEAEMKNFKKDFSLESFQVVVQ
jgi:hypothetical protein